MPARTRLIASLAAAFCFAACTHSPNDSGGNDGPDAAAPDAAVAPDAGYAGPHFCNATDPRTVPVSIVATPEAGEAPYVAMLTPATTKIRIEIYEMGTGMILDTLLAKLQAGVKVEIIFDQYEKSVNTPYYNQLQAAGALVKWSSTQFTYQHAKFIIVDDSALLISTGNFSAQYSILLERNFVATDTDPADIADLTALFDADWAGVAPDMSCTRMVISPVNSRQRVLDVINSATTTLTIESMQFADTQVRAAVAARVKAGVAVRVMIADAGWVTENTAAATYLESIGITPRYILHLHTKVIVADGVRAYMGSENLSETSLDHNREAGVVVVEPSSIAPLMTTFEKDWAAGTAY